MVARFRLDADCGLGRIIRLASSTTACWNRPLRSAGRIRTLAGSNARSTIPIPGSVMVPDFRLVHPDGRSFLLEIVGYWRPEYLRKKFAQVRRAGRHDLILAISERLNPGARWCQDCGSASPRRVV